MEVPLEGTAFLGKITTEYSGEFEFNYENLKLVGQIGASPQVYKTLTAVKLHEPRPVYMSMIWAKIWWEFQESRFPTARPERW